MSRRSLIARARNLSSLFLNNHSFLRHCRHSTSPLHSTAATSVANHFQNLCLPIGTTMAQLQQQKLLLHHHHHHHHLNLDFSFDKTPKTAILNQRFHYSSESTPNPNPNPSPNTKHQEIEGPTVEKDESPLANESREVTQSLLKTMYNVSGIVALLGLAHLGIGTYYCYCYTNAAAATATTANSSAQLFVMSALAFGFPFSMAFMLRQSLKSMHFFQKMEQIGRLQILTSTMQISKQLRLFFVRLRAISYLCLAGLCFSFIYSLSYNL
ncbi:uncharacterized protein LOC110702499 [Chenopodium quinoa]|uniref:uncharacterized protein LOC110702499 n=1 Tax=Chenopodium quinoa TaxID=63459 RepID=UPI000B79410C|nr:uncharacterized protein LOC110702499 [Chenopodium quinoa]